MSHNWVNHGISAVRHSPASKFSPKPQHVTTRSANNQEAQASSASWTNMQKAGFSLMKSSSAGGAGQGSDRLKAPGKLRANLFCEPSVVKGIMKARVVPMVA